jgi:hypothetical protein
VRRRQRFKRKSGTRDTVTPRTAIARGARRKQNGPLK